MSEGRRALLLGAGSQIAPFLSQRLAAVGWSGLALSRRPPPVALHPGLVWRTQEVITGGLPLGPWEAVISLLPLWLLPPLVPHLRGIERLVAFSSTSVHAKAASSDPEERALADRLAAAERDLLAICREHGMVCSLLRPTLIYGSGRDRNLSAIAGFIRRWGFFPVLRPGKGLRQPVHADDLAWAATACVEGAVDQELALDLPGGETLTYREMVRRVFLALGRRPVILSVPRTLMSRGGHWMRRFLPRGYSPALLGRMNEDLCFDVEPAARVLGYRPRPLLLQERDLGG